MLLASGLPLKGAGIHAVIIWADVVRMPILKSLVARGGTNRLGSTSEQLAIDRYSPIFTQLREPCLPKIWTRASTNSLFCSICRRDC